MALNEPRTSALADPPRKVRPELPAQPFPVPAMARKAPIRGFTKPTLGLARDKVTRRLADELPTMSAPTYEIDAIGGPQNVLRRIDYLEERIGAQEQNEDEVYRLRRELLDLWRMLATYCAVFMTLHIAPPTQKILFVKKLPVNCTHGDLLDLFAGSTDILFKLRAPPQLSRELNALVIFDTEANRDRSFNGWPQRKRGVWHRTTVEPTTNAEFFSKQWRYRLVLLEDVIAGRGQQPGAMRCPKLYKKATPSVITGPTRPNQQPEPDAEVVENAAVAEEPLVEVEDYESMVDELESVAFETDASSDQELDDADDIGPCRDSSTPTPASESERAVTTAAVVVPHVVAAAQLPPPQAMAVPPQPLPYAAPAVMPTITMENKTALWMIYRAITLRYEPEKAEGVTEWEYKKFTDEDVIASMDVVRDSKPSFRSLIIKHLSANDRLYGTNITRKWVSGYRKWDRIDFFAPREPGICAVPTRYANRLRFVNSVNNLHVVDTMVADALQSDFAFLAFDTEGQGDIGCRLLQLATTQWSVILDVQALRGTPEFAAAMKRVFDPNTGLSRIGHALKGDKDVLKRAVSGNDAESVLVRRYITECTVMEIEPMVARCKGYGAGWIMEEKKRLSHLAYWVLGEKVDKTQQVSYWGANAHFRPSQLKYAYLDAIIPILIAEQCQQLDPTAFRSYMPRAMGQLEDSDDGWDDE